MDKIFVGSSTEMGDVAGVVSQFFNSGPSLRATTWETALSGNRSTLEKLIDVRPTNRSAHQRKPSLP